jgi:hypothetical protein
LRAGLSAEAPGGEKLWTDGGALGIQQLHRAENKAAESGSRQDFVFGIMDRS